jgi:heme/copper-type cytochrome/quinol oxidase subunit 2
MLAYLAFVVISLLPTIAEQFIDFSNDTMSDHDVFDVLYVMMPMFVLGPIVQILGFVALWAQASEIKSRSSPGTEDALSVKGLLVQAVVFLLVGLSFLWRLRIPEDEEWSGYWLADLRKWYWRVGFATLNNLIFAVVQGVLAWIAWRYNQGDGGEVEEEAEGERTALLA